MLALEAYLVDQVRLEKRCLLVVDEAQNLSLRAVEELRMLSNFQFETQALLQTFLVGQPEFRTILQNPNMHQLRQRVTASCHIGPLDLNETSDYIEHRLKRAGSTGYPGFSEAAIEGIFRETNGVPRRINFVCDRLLLYGLLSEKTQFESDDVSEILREINEENVTIPSPSQLGYAQRVNPLSSELSTSEVDVGLSEALSNQIDRLGFEQYDARMRRLEGSVLRLERINLEILSMLKKFFSSMDKQKNETAT